MILDVSIRTKSIQEKLLFEDLSFTMQEHEKVAIIGRNGVGKTTLLRLITKEDKDFDGDVSLRKDSVAVFTKQELSISDDISSIDYVLSHVPSYVKLKEIIDTYPQSMGNDLEKISMYTDAIERFQVLGYFLIEEKIMKTFELFHLGIDTCFLPLRTLSGGEKKIVELMKVMYSGSDIAFIDEPTNHMDYIAKEQFQEWLETTDSSVLVVTHDRDVLSKVERIIEIKDRKAYYFQGNYNQYLKQNHSEALINVNKYEQSLRDIEKAHEQMMKARVAKIKGAKGAKTREERFKREFTRLKNSAFKPSLWIDQESLETTDETLVEKYEKYKERNIHIDTPQLQVQRNELLTVDHVSLGYDNPLFSNIHFTLKQGERIRLNGRNGAGKSTLIKTIISLYKGETPQAKIYDGSIQLHKNVRIGLYEQEVGEELYALSLEKAVIRIYEENNLVISYERVRQLLSMFLFNPQLEKDTLVQNLSGGQKARLQIIKMFSVNPNLLILDEPTNHLDLPSIEELEKVLESYEGGILYVSHDSYFVKALGGNEIYLP